MNKITFKNGQAPYLSDTNLNQMQTNTENAINEAKNSIENKYLKKIINFSYNINQVIPSRQPTTLTIPIGQTLSSTDYSCLAQAHGNASYGDWVTILNAYVSDSSHIKVVVFNQGDGPTTGTIFINCLLIKDPFIS